MPRKCSGNRAPRQVGKPACGLHPFNRTLAAVLAAGLLLSSSLLVGERRAAAQDSVRNEGGQRVRYTTVEDFFARAIARSMVGAPGGLTVAIWSDLSKGGNRTRYATRYLNDRQTVYTCYRDFVRKFSRFSNNPVLARNRALLIIGHAGYGLGLQDFVSEPRDLAELDVPRGIDWDDKYAPLEFVPISRVREDLADHYDLVVLGQCNPRKCLRFTNSDIPIGEELFGQIKRLSDRSKQLTIVRNRRENIYLVGKRVVYREPYRPAPYEELPRVVAPDVVAEQSVNTDPDRSSQTDVFILAGLWSDEPTEKIGEKTAKPTKEMIEEADRRVNGMLAEERGLRPRLAQDRP